MKLVKKIDIHVHTSESKWLAYAGNAFATPEELIKMYDDLGIELGVLLPVSNSAMVTSSNYENYLIAKKYPDRFVWFCTFDPMQGDNSKNANFTPFLEECKKHGAKGVGEITCNIPFDDERTFNLFSHVEKAGIPLTFHIGNQGGDYGLNDDIGLPGLEKALKTFPNLKFLGHSQQFWAEISKVETQEQRYGQPKGKVVEGRVVELMRKYPNLLGDLSAGSGYNAITRDEEFGYKFLEEFQDRLYFGTDICATSNVQYDFLKLAKYLDDAYINGKISYDTYYKVSRGNAIKLLGLDKE